MNKNYLLLFLLFLLPYCSANTGAKPTVPAGYSWQQAREVILEKGLDEISGLDYERKIHAFIAINDEKGKVYVIDTAAFRIREELPFGDKGDYEECIVTDDRWYVLRSDGHLYEMTYDGVGIKDVNKYKYEGKTTEFEAMYLDKANNRIVLIVKNAKKDHQEETAYGYAFDLASKQFVAAPVFQVRWSDVASVGKIKLKSFHPSAAAIHPITGELYVLASIEKLLVVLDKQTLKVKGVYFLDPKLCRQAEGLAFDPRGNMYISNEAADAQPNIVVFPYQSKNGRP
ncbi:SdiA-regulated domain-containing protein [Taibaiella soli]|uniref:SdiA-regulated family protein n=1 Tax=Taibaiella soli TaxID=1649169 RepID=A0A2W2B145_9BACT|nr:SdiA-regulated domain-containing protein [Taibaiella soli]PZF73718.1 hypothetical protein DN068_06900 [Taibaiella soli]